MVAVRALLLCCNLVSGMCSRARRRQQQRFGTAIARGSRLRCRHLQSRRTDNIISTNSRVVHPDNLPNCRGPIRLHSGGDGGRSCRPRFHQIGRLTVIDRLGVEVNRPAARDRIIAGGARNPRSSMHQTLPRKAPVGSFPCVLVAVLWVFVPPPPVAADSDDPIPGNCCGCALESPQLPGRWLGWISINGGGCRFCLLRYPHVEDVRARQGLEERCAGRWVAECSGQRHRSVCRKPWCNDLLLWSVGR